VGCPGGRGYIGAPMRVRVFLLAALLSAPGCSGGSGPSDPPDPREVLIVSLARRDRSAESLEGYLAFFFDRDTEVLLSASPVINGRPVDLVFEPGIVPGPAYSEGINVDPGETYQLTADVNRPSTGTFQVTSSPVTVPTDLVIGVPDEVDSGGTLAVTWSVSGAEKVNVAVEAVYSIHVPASQGQLTIPDSVFGFVGASVELFRPRFIEVTHYNGFAREEDVSLGTRLHLGVGAALPALGYPRAGVFPRLEAQTGFGASAAFVRLNLVANGLLTSAGVDSGQVRGSLTLASRLIPRQATVLYLQGGVQKNPAPGAEFDLGHGLGPRAFKPHAFTGTRSLWGVVEHRVFLWDNLFGLFGLGVAGFVDYGGAWFADQAARHGGDVGIGLRSGATSATGPNVGRLDLAYRFGDGITGSRWVVSFGTAYEF